MGRSGRSAHHEQNALAVPDRSKAPQEADDEDEHSDHDEDGSGVVDERVRLVDVDDVQVADDRLIHAHPNADGEHSCTHHLHEFVVIQETSEREKTARKPRQ